MWRCVHTLCACRSTQMRRGLDGKVLGSRLCPLSPWPLSAELLPAQTSPEWLAAGPDLWWHWSHAATVCQEHIGIKSNLAFKSVVKVADYSHSEFFEFILHFSSATILRILFSSPSFLKLTALKLRKLTQKLKWISLTESTLPFRLKLPLLVYLDNLSLEAAAADVWARVPQSLLLSGALLMNVHLTVLHPSKKERTSLSLRATDQTALLNWYDFSTGHFFTLG